MTDYYVVEMSMESRYAGRSSQNLGWSNSAALSGDLIDRGEDSRRVLEMVKDLVDNQGAICLSKSRVCF